MKQSMFKENAIWVTVISLFLCMTISCGEDSGVASWQENSDYIFTVIKLSDTEGGTECILSLSTDNLEYAKGISSEFISLYGEYDQVRFWFYKPGTDLEDQNIHTPLLGFIWERGDGFLITQDHRGIPNPKLPEYTVLDRVDQINGRVYADVLLPEVPVTTSPSTIYLFAHMICEEEHIQDISLYCTEDAYIANTYGEPEFYPRPVEDNALENGFLGSLDDGDFFSHEDWFGNE